PPCWSSHCPLRSCTPASTSRTAPSTHGSNSNTDARFTTQLMETETKTTTESRGFFGRLRASPFLSELISNRIAVAGLSIILGMVIIGGYARLFIDLGAISQSRLGAYQNKAPPARVGPAAH